MGVDLDLLAEQLDIANFIGDTANVFGLQCDFWGNRRGVIFLEAGNTESLTVTPLQGFTTKNSDLR